MSEQTNVAAPATAGDIMRPALTTVEQNDHLAAAAYLMKHTAETVLVVIDTRSDETVGIITEGDVSQAVADGNDVNDVRVHAAMTTPPVVIGTATSIRDAAEIMTKNHFRHLAVVGHAGILGIVEINDVCRVLIGVSANTSA
jgi:CBS domain-containing protein